MAETAARANLITPSQEAFSDVRSAASRSLVNVSVAN
jgi:hypothetical protein